MLNKYSLKSAYPEMINSWNKGLFAGMPYIMLYLPNIVGKKWIFFFVKEKDCEAILKKKSQCEVTKIIFIK